MFFSLIVPKQENGSQKTSGRTICQDDFEPKWQFAKMLMIRLSDDLLKWHLGEIALINWLVLLAYDWDAIGSIPATASDFSFLHNLPHFCYFSINVLTDWIIGWWKNWALLVLRKDEKRHNFSLYCDEKNKHPLMLPKCLHQNGNKWRNLSSPLSWVAAKVAAAWQNF